ncbi:MAG: DEAD/DEAH box helicase [Saprospiraceae bacterium]
MAKNNKTDSNTVNPRFYYENKLVDAAPFLEKWERLTGADQRILRIVALNWIPISMSAITKLHAELYTGTTHSLIQKTCDLCRRMDLLTGTAAQYKCPPAFAHWLCEHDAAANNPEQPRVVHALRKVYFGFWELQQSPHVFRRLRLARYSGDAQMFKQEFVSIETGSNAYTADTLFAFWLPDNAFEASVARLPKAILAYLMVRKLMLLNIFLDDPEPYLSYAWQHIGLFEGPEREEALTLMGLLFLFQGDYETHRACMSHMSPTMALGQQAIVSVLQGQFEQARAQFSMYTIALRKENRSYKLVAAGLPGFFHGLALLETRNPAHFDAIQLLIERNSKRFDANKPLFDYLNGVMLYLQNDTRSGKALLGTAEELGEYVSMYLEWFRMACAALVDGGSYSAYNATDYAVRLQELGYHRAAAELWAAAEYAADWDAVQAKLTIKQPPRITPAEGRPLCALFPRSSAWENALNALDNLTAQTVQKSTRIIWLVNFEKQILEARVQTLGKAGWTKGRAVNLDRLTSEQSESMSDQDKLLIAAINTFEYGYYRRVPSAVWKMLVGHPLLFLEKSPEVAVHFEAREPVLLVSETKGGFQLSFSPPIKPDEGLQIIKESPTRYLLVQTTPEQMRMATALGGPNLFVPQEGAERLKNTLHKVSGLSATQSPFQDASLLDSLPERAADSRPTVHVLPVGDGYHVEIFAKPFGDTPPYCLPGKGEPVMVAVVEGVKMRTLRDLRAETANTKALIKQLDTLRETGSTKGLWVLPDIESCLRFLAEIQPIVAEGNARLEWPKGEKFRMSVLPGLDRLQLSVRSKNHWFEVEGHLEMEEGRVLQLQELLYLSEQQKSPFVELEPGRFFALTASLRKQLAEVSGLLQAGRKAKGPMQLHPLAAPALQSLVAAAPLAQTDEAFTQSVKRLEKAFKQKFPIPKNFNAELRPYQTEGFQWLHRMAAWGVGACLADDMGLGKTIQALAFLTDRAALGPALVVAPSSVCGNWAAETTKFAPALRPILFGEGDRASTIEQLTAGDLLIVTYDLLARERALFAAPQWATVILDEAQAIKNRQTKRSEAVMELQAGFRLLMSGTPIENRLSELWNLFQFINPGLLGSEEVFNERFALPIEKNKDPLKSEQLRKLVKPFILRRRKDEVLRELPAKTEIMLKVPLSPEERAFYEALRRNALMNLEAGTDAPAGEKHLKILAEIMRLRRAACHPRLADPNAAPSSSAKLTAFAELVDELLQNGHKALVFSQFVGHLDILCKHLDERKITYQYLDGQTPAPTRRKRIDAFQSGEGDLFLISLKAGGVGLNLTAADYVIHMDPWWNPAVEDQATDRAHRIGQDKPVTVYRIVTENTIEEKIIRLHEQKRDLADALLAGTNESARMSAEDLMALLRSEG